MFNKIYSYSILFTTTLVSSIYLYFWIKNKYKKTFIPVTKVDKLFIYPVKGLKGVEVNSLEITNSVVKYGNFLDRSWIILDRGNRFVTIKHVPKFAFTKCSFHNDNELWIDGPDMPTLKLKIIESLTEAKTLNFIVYSKEISGIDCGVEAKQWFETFTGKPGLSLIQHHPNLKYRNTNFDNNKDNDHKFPIIYQNKAGLHLVNNNSVNDLNNRLSEGSDKVCFENFRPNVLVDYEKAWDEDFWKYIKINNVSLVLLQNCDRCLSTTVDPNTGKAGLQTLKALKKFRPTFGLSKDKSLGPRFGCVYGPLSKGIINVNDSVYVSYGKLDDFPSLMNHELN